VIRVDEVEVPDRPVRLRGLGIDEVEHDVDPAAAAGLEELPVAAAEHDLRLGDPRALDLDLAGRAEPVELDQPHGDRLLRDRRLRRRRERRQREQQHEQRWNHDDTDAASSAHVTPPFRGPHPGRNRRGPGPQAKGPGGRPAAHPCRVERTLSFGWTPMPSI
jgi:hypothetical protein